MDNHKIRDLIMVLFAFLFALLSPRALLGANIPSIADVVEGKASPPTIEDLTGGKVKNNGLVDKNNVELVKNYLTASMYESVKRGMVLKMGTQLPPDQLNPKVFRDITEKNRGKAIIDKNGVVYYEKMGTLWPGGRPFPVVKSGVEAMANSTFGKPWDTYMIDPARLCYINSKGEIYKTVDQTFMYVKYTTRTMIPPLGAVPGSENVLVKRIAVAAEPREIKGLGQFTVRYYDPAKQYDTGFAYLPAFKRTIRISATTWQDNIAGSDAIYGDGDGFNEPYYDWNLKLIEKKFLLVPEPKMSVRLTDQKMNINKDFQFDVGKKYPRLGWVIWPVDVVEAIPNYKNVYGKRVLYFPCWPYSYSYSAIAAVDIYDRQMKLWKNFFFIYGGHEYLNGDRDKPQTSSVGALTVDLQSEHRTLMLYTQLLNTNKIGTDSLSLGKLIEMGR